MQDGAAGVVGTLGEFPLIARFARRIPAPLAPAGLPGLKIGIGDDAAAWAPTPHTWTVVTADALIEDVHFRRATTDAGDLGWKSLAVNLSDVAAMGARPRYAVVTLGLPGDTPVAWVDAYYQGLADVAARYDTLLVGGDTVRAGGLAISVTVFGETAVVAEGEPPLLRRDRARPGDLLAVTGALGASAGGLRLLEAAPIGSAAAPRGAGGRGADEALLLAAHRRPVPRVAAAETLVRVGVRCAMDLSDGLVSDARRLAEASEVRVVVEAARVPVAPALQRRFPSTALALALAGGEDYELLCAAPPAVIAAARDLLAREQALPLTVVGRIEAAGAPAVTILDADGRPATYASGWSHFGEA